VAVGNCLHAEGHSEVGFADTRWVLIGSLLAVAVQVDDARTIRMAGAPHYGEHPAEGVTGNRGVD